MGSLNCDLFQAMSAAFLSLRRLRVPTVRPRMARSPATAALCYVFGGISNAVWFGKR